MTNQIANIKRNIFFVLLLLLFSGCGHAPSTNDHADAVFKDSIYLHQIDSLNRLLFQKDTLIIDMFMLLVDIQESLNDIQLKKISFLRSFTVFDESKTDSIKKEFKKHINETKSLLKRNKDKVATLQLLIEKNNIEIQELSNAIMKFEQEINARNRRIANLEQQLKNNELKISELEEIVASLYEEFEGMGNAIIQQEKQLNTAWYCVADRKILINSALISKKGKVLSIDASLAEKIDIRMQKEIPVNSKRATILTAHPANSYQFVKDKNQIEKIVILNPSEFWSISKYCVVQIKN
ncbi:MAG: hypothetical protein LBH92_02910 [Bacteroidales bacterium]|jgi:chromosome segregation ATPase|nr:hypothetical protein [Bacteroidales bacterium]